MRWRAKCKASRELQLNTKKSAYLCGKNPTVTFPKDRKGFLAGLLLLTIFGQTAQGASLFGDHACVSWQSLPDTDKRAWTNAFLAPLSLTLKGLQKRKEDPYNDDPKAALKAIVGIDAFCLNHPDLGVADGAGRYLKKLLDMPPT